MNSNTLAYIAGVIDSDGTIGIKRSTYSMRVRKDSTQPIFSERVCVKQVEPHAVDLIHKTFGGYRTIDDPTAKRGKPLHVIQLTNLQASRMLSAILPHLRIKKAQAQNCMALRRAKERSKIARVRKGRGHVGAAIRPAALGDRMEALCVKGHLLNKVGV